MNSSTGLLSRMPPRKSHIELPPPKGGVLDVDEYPPLPSQKTDGSTCGQAIRSSSKIHRPHEATLNDLPTEMILQILDYLPALDLRHFELSTILSLSSTDKRMHNIVTDRLYNAYNSFFCKPFPFLRTMMTNPVAASMVKTVIIAYGSGVHEERSPYTPSLDDKRTIKTGFKSLDLQDWKTWASECNTQDVEQEMLYAAILMHTPNITTLDVDDGKLPYHLPKWVEILSNVTSGKVSPQMHHFSQLRSICIDIGSLRLRNLVFLFRLPSLRHVKIKGLVETENPQQAKRSFKWPIQAGGSLIEGLFFSDCFLHTAILANMINSCRALKNIWYNHRDDRWYYQLRNGRNDLAVYLEAPLVPVDYQSLDSALYSHRHSLKTLQIEHGVEHAGAGRLKCISEMEMLEHVATPPRALVDNSLRGPHTLLESLPSSLTTLQLLIERDEPKLEPIPEALEYMASHYRDYVPKLKTVIVHSQAPPSRITLAPLSKVYSKNGIHLRIIQKPEDVEVGWGDSGESSWETSDESDDSDALEEDL